MDSPPRLHFELSQDMRSMLSSQLHQFTGFGKLSQDEEADIQFLKSQNSLISTDIQNVHSTVIQEKLRLKSPNLSSPYF